MHARLITAVTLLAMILTSGARAESWHLWVGDQYLGDVPAARPGLHEGPEMSIGGEPYRAVWEAGSATPMLQHVGPTPPPVVPPRMELVVVTTEDLATRSVLLEPYLQFREAEGWDVALITDVDWDVPVSAGDDSPQGRLRHHLQQLYADDPGAYLLLIGDPHPEEGGVPMKNVHPLSSVVHYYDEWLAAEMDPMPTDFYYADLDGEWDCDGDDRYGEYPDDAGAGCVDFGPELYVGRLPVAGDDPDDLDTLLGRILDRDLEPDKSYRRDVLLPGAIFGVDGAPAPVGDEYSENDDGACILDAVYRDLPEEFQAGTTRLFEDEGLCVSPYPHEGPLNRDLVVEQWSQGRGLVIWAGHGGPNGVYRTLWVADHNGDGDADSDECDYPPFMESTDHVDLRDAPGAFTFHISCDNGFPEVADNIGAQLLYGGAAATATASRPAFGVTVAWGEMWEPRPDLGTASTTGYYYAMQIADGLTAGEALAWTKYGLPGDGWTEDIYGVDFTGAAWATRVEYNLYGDPTRSLELCEADADCDDGSPCNGTETCSDGFCVHHDPIDCSHLDDVCTRGSCDHSSGECLSVPRQDGTTCDDGAWCTEYDACTAGVCGGEERDCGERDGYLAVCDEELQSCLWEELTAGDDDDDAPVEVADGCACGQAPGPAHGPVAPWTALLSLAALFALRLRRRLDLPVEDRTMSRSALYTLLGLLTLSLVLALGGCTSSGTIGDDDDSAAGDDDDDDDDTGGSTDTLDLEGVVVDDYLDGAPVSDAWIVVDTGDELISARSSGDGSFSIPALPAQTPIALTVAGENRRALTYADLVLADVEMPLELTCHYRDTTYYDFPTIHVSGDVIGAPEDTYVVISGPGMEDYPYFLAEDDGSTAFEFEAVVFGDPETYVFSALVQDGYTGELLGAGAAEVDVASEVEVDLELVAAEPLDLAVSVNQPLLNGEPLDALDDYYVSSVGLVNVGEYGALAGWTSSWDFTGSGFDIFVDYVPIDGFQHQINLYLAEDLTAQGDFSYLSIPFDAGIEDLELVAMHSPVLSTDGDFGPGVTVSWDPVDMAESYGLYVMDGDEPAWWISTDLTEVTFPRFPDGFDTDLILGTEGEWAVRAQYYEEIADGVSDYRVSETLGGTASF